MTAALNGKHLAEPPPDPAPAIAEAVWTANMADGDATFADLEEGEQTNLIDYARHYLAAHVTWLQSRGFRIIPPGAAVIPKTDDEAAAMLLAVKSYRDGKKRKGGLLVQDKKLILPPGAH